MGEISIKKTGFVSYECEKGREIGFDMNKLKDLLKLAEPGDQVEWSMDEAKNKMVFKVGNVTRFMGIIDMTAMTDPRVPKIDLPNSLLLEVKDLQKGINAALAITDHVALIANESGLVLEAEGDTEKVVMTFVKDVHAKEIKAAEKEVRSMFPLDYLNTMVKAIQATQVRIHLGQSYPTRLVFKFADGAGDGSFLLAPRIEE
jgi:proliferating cell nuclear antigen